MKALKEYSIKAQNMGHMSGSCLAVHAIPDAFLLLHTGVGCKYKTSAAISKHDWQLHPNRGEGWTEVGDSVLIRGAAERIGPYVRTWKRRRNPELIFVVSSTFLEMTGEDIGAAIKAASEYGPYPVIWARKERGLDDLHSGYADVLLRVAERVDWRTGLRHPGEVALLGYFFDRYEMDHAANILQIKFMLKSIGLELGPIFLSGRPFTELKNVAQAEHLLLLPYGQQTASQLQSICGRTLINVDLPIGLSGSAAWVRRVGEAVGAEKKRTEWFIEKQVQAAKEQISKVATRVRGFPVTIFADTPLAAGLSCLMMDLDMRPVRIGLRDESLGGRTAYIEAVERMGHRLPAEIEILEAPSTLEAKALLRKKEEWQLVIGSSDERIMADRSTRFIEIGFPSAHYHVTKPEPYMGFGGAIAFAQRVIDVIK